MNKTFSGEVKEELSKISNLANKENVKFEFLGYLCSNQITIKVDKENKENKENRENKRDRKNKKETLLFSTDNEYNINRFSKLLDNLSIKDYEIDTNGKTFTISLKNLKNKDLDIYGYFEYILCNEFIKTLDENIEYKKDFVRGIFLGGGSINNPKNTYRLEVNCNRDEYCIYLSKILKEYGINFKDSKRKNGHCIYLTESQQISNFLAFLGANKAVIKLEEIRVYKDVKNKVNRKVNCETANLNKTIETALKQIEDINYLIEKEKLSTLSVGLQTIASLRIEHPEASLVELGKMLEPNLGKSGVNHRLKTLEQLAEDLRKSLGE